MIYRATVLYLSIMLGMQGFLPLPLYAQDELPASSANQQQTSSLDLINTPVQSIVFPSSSPIRPFAVAGESPAPPLPVPAHFAPPVTDGNFGNLIQLLTYKDLFSKSDAEALLDNHGDLRVLTSCYLPEKNRVHKDTIRIVPDPKDKADFREHYETIGIGNYKALDPDTTSEQVLGMAINEGLNIGADVMLFQEGATLVHTSKGFSIGFFNSFSFVNSASDSTGKGNVSVGGIGYGKGESSYASKPWLRVQFFQKKRNSTSAIPVVMPQQSMQQDQKQSESSAGGHVPTPEEIKVIQENPALNPSNEH